MTHLTPEQMIEFIETPEAAHLSDFRDHLVHCAQCRTELASLEITVSEFKEKHAGLSIDQTALHRSIDPLTLENYFSGSLSTQEHDKIKAELSTNPQLKKEALHYLTHTSAMNRSVEQASPERTKTSWLEGLFSWLNGWQLPVWQPVTASVSFVLVLGVLFSTGQTELMQFQNDKGIYWQTPQPGMGFFQLATAEKSDYPGVDVSQSAETLAFSWPEVEGVSDYRFEVQTLNEGRVQSLGETVVQTNQANIPIERFTRGKHYEWVLSGLASDGREFQARGGFVLMTSGN
jgi:hypothetical protein